MATSGSTDWTLNRNQVITGALRKLAVLPSGGTPSSAQIADAADALNAIVKAFQADGMPLWKIKSTSFTVSSGTSSYTVGVGSTVNVAKPLKVLQAFYTTEDTAQVPMRVENYYDFNQLPVLAGTTVGIPNTLQYKPGRVDGTLRLWPTPNDSTTQITIHYQAPFEDMDNATDDFDFPSEWMQALIYTLAWSLAPEYGIPPTDRTMLSQEAKYWHEYALSIGTEEGSVYLQPNTRG